MREIEFRGKSIMEGTEGRWLYSFGIKYGDDTELLYCDEETSDTWYYVDRETIEQYTGLKDKNGKKIFEGDIVKDQYCIYEVVYDGNGYYVEVYRLLKECGTDIGLLYDLSDYKDLEVIGNIWDNPELLKEEL